MSLVHTATSGARLPEDVVCFLCPPLPSLPPHPGVNVWDQTLFLGRAQVTLTTKRHRHPGKVCSPQEPQKPGQGARS